MRRVSGVWLAMTLTVVGMSQPRAANPAAIPAQAIVKALGEASGLRLQFAVDGQPSPGNPTSVPQGAMVPGGATKGPLLVSDLSITPGSEGGVTIEIATTGSAPFHVLRLSHPDRLVVDLQGARNELPRNSIPVSSTVVKDVRAGQFRDTDPEVVRVVADLSGDPVFEVQAFTGGVRIEVKPRPKAASRAIGTAPAPKLETAKRRDEAHPIQPSVPARDEPESSRVEVPQGPATNGNSGNSNPIASPGLKEKDKPQMENPQAVPVLDDVLRFLFGPNAPTPGTGASPAKQRAVSPAQKPEGPPLVSDISVRPGPAGEITIDVALTTSSPFQASRIEHPDRFVLDVKGAKSQFPRNSILVDSSVVKDVRVSQFREENPWVVRVVVDLSENPVCNAHAYANGVRIEVKPRGLGTGASGETR